MRFDSALDTWRRADTIVGLHGADARHDLRDALGERVRGRRQRLAVVVREADEILPERHRRVAARRGPARDGRQLEDVGLQAAVGGRAVGVPVGLLAAERPHCFDRLVGGLRARQQPEAPGDQHVRGENVEVVAGVVGCVGRRPRLRAHEASRHPEAVVDELHAGRALGDGVLVDSAVDDTRAQQRQHPGKHRRRHHVVVDDCLEPVRRNVSNGLSGGCTCLFGLLHHTRLAERTAKTFGKYYHVLACSRSPTATPSARSHSTGPTPGTRSRARG
ncbi:hypothetical protein VNG_2034H [Halobacterium salinarum NRC-1]|uniref:Spurious ORF n=1 Tax=Halobacterium salinarum (strain ATCC 700922 / JCM 11081 / NRC-1) TaxID=64091 RepID=Q9HNM5_HALSA|nr:hypothetical protein VNG_2034H [Halobacterium salinarum NRC-1]DAC78939.1 TPA_inf: spurious ORF [Halobacterium salinarum NRC-1]